MMLKLSQTEEGVERRVGALEQAVMGLAETKDLTIAVESDVASLRTMMADGNAKVEEVRREAADLKAQLSECCPKMNQGIANLEQELAKLKEEMRELRVLKAAMVEQRLRHEQKIHDMKQEAELLRKASDDQHKSQERERQAMAEE
jgi:chromosome segregation ATPase